MTGDAARLAPHHLLAKPAGAARNLGCQYCFLLSKENLYPRESHLMTPETLERCLRQLFESSPGQEVHVAWQGGEPGTQPSLVLRSDPAQREGPRQLDRVHPTAAR